MTMFQYRVCQCPLGLLPHFYNLDREIDLSSITPRVNALSGCYLISTPPRHWARLVHDHVSMPSRAVTSFLLSEAPVYFQLLVIVSMPSRAVTSFLLITVVFTPMCDTVCVNALSGCYLISTSIDPHYQFWIFWVSMPSRAVTSFLRIMAITKST